MAWITVIGSFVVDNVARMDDFPKIGQTVLGNSIEHSLGGKGVNQCISIARLNGDVEMCGMLGNDTYGEEFLSLLREEGVKTDYVFTCDKPTAVAQVQVDKSGQNRICVIPSANYEFDFTCVDKIDDVIKNTEWVVLQLELRYEVIAEIVRRANRYGTKIVLNPAPGRLIDDEILSMVDYLTPNEAELSILSGGMPLENDEQISKASEYLLEKGVKNIIATLGSRGAMIVNRESIKRVDGYSVKSVDTVAAGDSFIGALIVGLSENMSLQNAVSFANAMGALTVTQKGAIPSLHKRDQVETFMKNNQ